MNIVSEKIKVIPCSGMGKVFGLLSRESVLMAVGELCPKEAETVCLAYIVTGDEEAKEMIRGKKCITMDGCPAMCAAASVEHEGGDILAKMKVMDVYRNYKGAKPGSATALTEEGWEIAGKIADEIAVKIRSFKEEELV